MAEDPLAANGEVELLRLQAEAGVTCHWKGSLSLCLESGPCPYLFDSFALNSWYSHYELGPTNKTLM